MSRTFAAGLSPILNSASGVSSATWWQACKRTTVRAYLQCKNFLVTCRLNVSRPQRLSERLFMPTITLTVLGENLSDEMTAMRDWLDRNQHQPTRFDCDRNGQTVIVSVAFGEEAAAIAFASRFGGYRAPAP